MALRDMTRPRMAGSARSCNVALLVAMKEMLAAPIGTSRTMATSFGRGQRRPPRSVSPKNTPITARRRVEGRLRCAVKSPPDHRTGAHGGQERAVEPGAAVEGDLGQERERDREIEGEHPDDGHGDERRAQVAGGPHVAQPFTNLTLAPADARLGVAGRRARISERATMTAMYEAALTMKQVETPRVRIRTPPMAGPMTRAPFMTTLLRLTALGRRSRPTISETNVCRAGLSNRLTTPSSADSTNTCQSWIECVMTSSPSSSARTPGRGLGGVEDLALVQPVGDQALRTDQAEAGARTGGRWRWPRRRRCRGGGRG